MHTTRSAFSFALAIGLFGCVADDTSDVTSAVSSNLSGAIFTTTATGDRVDANIYPSKDAVYLDGGPGNGAPIGAAALPAGDYCFQVTDPSGHTLLSSDPLACRAFHIDGDGVIDAVASGCGHVTGNDVDHDALTVQLMPYADTPNHGGEYKAWVSLCSNVVVDEEHPLGRFVDRYSKTDNFKVRERPCPPPVCGNGIVEDGEQCDDGNTCDGDGCSSTCQWEPICDGTMW